MHNFVVSQHSLGHPVKHTVRAGPPAAAATGEQQPCSAPPLGLHKGHEVTKNVSKPRPGHRRRRLTEAQQVCVGHDSWEPWSYSGSPRKSGLLNSSRKGRGHVHTKRKSEELRRAAAEDCAPPHSMHIKTFSEKRNIYIYNWGWGKNIYSSGWESLIHIFESNIILMPGFEVLNYDSINIKYTKYCYRYY